VHPLFNTHFHLRVSTALAAAEHVGALGHRGLAGQLRELVVRELLRPIAPHCIGFGTGKIVDHVGGESRQIDLIIYDKRMMPPLLFALDEPLGLYPIEACLYAIEVKTKATARDVRHAMDVGESVGALTYVPEHCLGDDPLSHVTTLLFSFDSTLKTPEREHERWRKLQLDRPRTRVARVADAAGNWVVHLLPPLLAACVVGRGYGYYDPLRGEGSFGWLSDMPHPNDEVLSCMAGISNTLLGATHRPGLPFGRYFLGP
jgi:hypothetical protein